MLAGIGLGFRRDLADALINWQGPQPAFVELAPENWMQIGGFWKRKLLSAAEKYPLTAHGLSLSLGSPEPLDREFLKNLKQFFAEVPVQIYTEHLSYAKCGNAHLYDLLPIPFREDAVRHAASRIKEVQDFLGRKIAVENVSYYTPVAPEMEEHEFISAVVEEADCLLLLDVNNVFVNAFNHKYDAKDFIKKLPLDRVAYIHMAGHDQVSEDLIIDTHGAPVIDPVYELFEWTAQLIKPVPVLLERDFNIPEIDELMTELQRLNEIASRHWNLQDAA